jgi:hypothetical protein
LLRYYKDEGTLRLSHLRELVTIIEMQAGRLPLSKTQFRALGRALSWLETIKTRINNINYRNAKIEVETFISQLPNGLVSLPPTFYSDVVEFRNTLVHHLDRLNHDDDNKLAFFVAKLKSVYALSDAVALGARVDEIRTESAFLLAAEHMPMNVFGDDTADGSP